MGARMPVQRPSVRGQEIRPEAVLSARRHAVLSARRPVQRPLVRAVRRSSWAPSGPSGGRLWRQEARREAVLGARRPVGGCLGRQEAEKVGFVFVGFADSSSENVGFADSSSENVGFA